MVWVSVLRLLEAAAPPAWLQLTERVQMKVTPLIITLAVVAGPHPFRFKLEALRRTFHQGRFTAGFVCSGFRSKKSKPV